MSVVKTFINGIRIITKGGKGDVIGDRSLSRMALIVKAQIPTYGNIAVRNSLIKGVEADIKRASKKADPEAEVEKLIQNCLRTPAYMELLEELNMNENHLRYMAKEVIPYGKRV
jgi:hypothetical protein